MSADARKTMILAVSDMVDERVNDGATEEQAKATTLQEVISVLYGDDDPISNRIAELLGERLKEEA